MHSQAQELVVQGLQRQAEPVLVPGDQAALLRDRCQAQPRLARVRIQQHRLLSQPACTCSLCQTKVVQAEMHARHQWLASKQGVVRSGLCPEMDREAAAHISGWCAFAKVRQQDLALVRSREPPETSTSPMAGCASACASLSTPVSGGAVSSSTGGPSSSGAATRRRRLRRPSRASTCFSEYRPCLSTVTWKASRLGPGCSTTDLSLPCTSQCDMVSS